MHGRLLDLTGRRADRLRSVGAPLLRTVRPPQRRTAPQAAIEATTTTRSSCSGSSARAKAFGLSLDEITEVLDLLAEERCEPVQSRLRGLVGDKIADTQGRIAELVAFTAELQHVAASLSLHTPDGPCDDTCGCTTDLSVRPAAEGSPAHHEADRIRPTLPSRARSAPRTSPNASLTGKRSSARPKLASRTDGGIRLRLPPDIDVAAVAALAAAEQTCCQFFTFRLTIGATTTLDITGPADALPVIEALVGAPR